MMVKLCILNNSGNLKDSLCENSQQVQEDSM